MSTLIQLYRRYHALIDGSFTSQDGFTIAKAVKRSRKVVPRGRVYHKLIRAELSRCNAQEPPRGPDVKRHPRCKIYSYRTDNGWDYGCRYPTVLNCYDCKYGVGRRNPEAKCNQL